MEKDCWTQQLSKEDAIDCNKWSKLIKAVVQYNIDKDRE